MEKTLNNLLNNLKTNKIMKTKKQEPKKGLISNQSGDEKVNKAKGLMKDALDLLKEVETEEVKKSENGISREKWEKSIIRTNIMHHILNAINEDYKEIELSNTADFMELGEDAFIKNVHEKLRETLSPTEKQMWINGYLLALTQQNKRMV